MILYNDAVGLDYYAPSMAHPMFGFPLETYRSTPQTKTYSKSAEVLVFDGKKICLLSSDRVLCHKCWEAASGKPVNGMFFYTKERQKTKDDGPLPEGEYWLPTRKTSDPGEYGNWDTDDWNEYASWGIINYLPWRTNIGSRNKRDWGERFGRMRIAEGTQTYGRSQFNIHGGWEKGSSGCIDIGDNDSGFFDRIRALDGEEIKVIVDYSGVSSKACDCNLVFLAGWRE